MEGVDHDSPYRAAEDRHRRLTKSAAIDAVKRWRYTPLPYEGIVSVTVNFTLA